MTASYRYALFCALAFTALLSACNMTTIDEDKEISRSEREHFRREANRLYNAFYQHNSDYLKKMIVTHDTRIDEGLDNMVQYLSPMKGDAEILKQYHIKTASRAVMPLRNGDYIINFTPYGDENFVNIFSIPGVNDRQRALVYSTFVKQDKEWKLVKIHVGPYTYDGRGATEWYDFTKETIDNREYITAFIYKEIMRNVFHPADPYITYDRTEEADQLYTRITNETKNQYNFPIAVREGNDLAIIGFEAMYADGLYLPCIYLATNVPAGEADGEVDAVHQSIESYLKGVSLAQKTIYRVQGKGYKTEVERDNW